MLSCVIWTSLFYPFYLNLNSTFFRQCACFYLCFLFPIVFYFLHSFYITASQGETCIRVGDPHWRLHGERQEVREKYISLKEKKKAWWKEKEETIKSFPPKECHPLNRLHLVMEQKSTVEEIIQPHRGLTSLAMLLITMPESIFKTLTVQELWRTSL